MKVLVAKLGKSNNECSDVSLGLRKLHYNFCSINRFFINGSRSIIFKDAFIATVQVQSTSEHREGSRSNEAGSTCQSRINRKPCALRPCAAKRAALPDLLL